MASANRIEISRILGGSIAVVFDRSLTLAKALLIPFVLYVALDFLPLYGKMWGVVISVLVVAIHTVFAVTTHRIIILGRGSVPEYGLRSWSRRESYFAIHLVAIAFFPVVPLMLSFAVPLAVVIPGLILGLWITARVSLVLPGIAVDKDVSFALAWQLSKRHQFPLVIIVLVFPVLVSIPFVLVDLLPFGAVWSSVLSTLALVFTVAALSLSYLEIEKLEYGGGASPVGVGGAD